MTFPFDNDTDKVVKRLAQRSLQNEKRRNLMIVMAIGLAAFLMSMCGTMMFAFNRSQNSMATFEVIYHGLTSDMVGVLRQKPEIELAGKIYNWGEWRTRQDDIMEYVYMDEAACYIAGKQYELLDGVMPSASDEIAADRAYLDSYAPDSGIGSRLTLPVNDKMTDFTVSAIISSTAKVRGRYMFFVSDAFIRNSPDYDPAAYEAYVHFRDADEIPKDALKSMGAAIGEEIDARYDYSYLYFKDNMKLSVGNVLVFAGLVTLVLFAGVVVIQSVFRISVNEKIRSYGQLRTVGATRKQIRRIVKRESRKLSWIGIPIGLVIGDMAGNFMGSNQYASGFSLTNTILISGLVAGISFIMVEISISKPVRIAEAATPIEAVRFTPYQGASGRDHRSHKKIAPIRLAVLNLGRDRKRSASTLLSLILGGLLLFLSASVSVSYSPEQNVRTKLFVNGGDFRIFLSEGKLTDQIRLGTPLDEVLRREILAIDGVREVIDIRDSVGEFYYKADGAEDLSGVCDVLSEDKATEGQYDFVARNLVEGRMPEHKYEVLALDLLLEVSDAAAGDRISLTVNEKTVDATIVGFYDTTFVGTENGNMAQDGPNLMITEELAREFLPGADRYDYAWEIVTDSSKDAGIQSGLEELLAHASSHMSLCVVQDEIEFMASQMNLLFGGLQLLSMLIFLFGVVNLVNMTLSNQHSRKREYSMMRSVGLTQKQLYQMMLLEGALYIGVSTGTVLIIGLPASVLINRVMGGILGLRSMPYRFPTVYVGGYLLALFLLQLVLSVWSIRDMGRHSLVEQMRAAE